MRVNRRRRLILWSLGMGMVAAFIQSRLAAARMVWTEPQPDHERDRLEDVESVDFPNSVSPLWIKDGKWTDSAEVSRVFGHLTAKPDRLGDPLTPPDAEPRR